jgi:hypothetical protein
MRRSGLQKYGTLYTSQTRLTQGDTCPSPFHGYRDKAMLFCTIELPRMYYFDLETWCGPDNHTVLKKCVNWYSTAHLYPRCEPCLGLQPSKPLIPLGSLTPQAQLFSPLWLIDRCNSQQSGPLGCILTIVLTVLEYDAFSVAMVVNSLNKPCLLFAFKYPA